MLIQGDPAPLFAALAKARAEFRKIQKTREVKVQSERGSYTFSYAELDELIDATVPALAAHGLAIFHTRETNDGKETITHILAHSSGAYISASQVVPMVKEAWDKQGNQYEKRLSEQEFGSAFTYARRYAYQALLNLAAEDDDDANKADGNQVQEARDRRQAPQPKPEPKAAPNGSQRPPTVPPPPDPLVGDLTGGFEDTRPAQSDEALDKALGAAFSSLKKDYSPPVLNSWARKVVGKVPSGWTVSDGRRFLAAYNAGERPL